MSDKRNDLPANSGINTTTDDRQHKQQEEFDNRNAEKLQNEGEVRNDQRTEQMRDSQQGDERMRPESKGQRESQKSREQHPQ